MAEEKERSADSLPHWFYFIFFFGGEFLPKLPVCSLIWFLWSEASLAACQEPAPTAADREGQSAVTSARRNSRSTSKAEKRCNCATEVIYSYYMFRFSFSPLHGRSFPLSRLILLHSSSSVISWGLKHLPTRGFSFSFLFFFCCFRCYFFFMFTGQPFLFHTASSTTPPRSEIYGGPHWCFNKLQGR